MPFVHEVRIRYVDCDMQGVVYNAHYLTFVDDGFDCWLRELDPQFEQLGWEVMLKRAEITWDGPTEFGEILTITIHPSRWGRTSFDVAFAGTVGERPVFEAQVTYVVVDHREHRPVEIPDSLRRHLST